MRIYRGGPAGNPYSIIKIIGWVPKSHPIIYIKVGWARNAHPIKRTKVAWALGDHPSFFIANETYKWPEPQVPLCNTFSLNLLTTVTLNVISIV